MRSLRILPVMICLSLLAPAANAQTGDWQAVENVPAGSRITVKERHRHTCILERATDRQLTCNPDYDFVRPGPVVFDRREIREVRLEHSKAANGAAIGLAAGGGCAIAGANGGSGTLTRGATVVFAGLGCGIIGGLIGRNFKVLPGKVIYQR